MKGGRSPPKNRHDGTSPLPLGMDWIPPPTNLNGHDTIWSHDPSNGWSYCVTVPSWVTLTKSSSNTPDPVVFYRVQVGILSPAGVTTIHEILKRFNDFLKLFSDLRKAFPERRIPYAPPKGLLPMKTRALLEERRSSLENWISKLVLDIDISRSMAVASFLELEAAARTSFEEASQQPSEAKPSTSSRTSSSQVVTSVTVTVSSSVASDYGSVDNGSDTTYETSELGSPSFGKDDSSEADLEGLMQNEELSNPNINDGLLMEEKILGQLEASNIMVQRQLTDIYMNDKVENMFEGEGGTIVVNHTQQLSRESIVSDLSFRNDGELSNSLTFNMVVEPSLDGGSPEMQFHDGGKIAHPSDQQPKLNRFLTTIQQRLVTAKSDMEDLITRLNQEVAVKEYLTSKVKDLEVELETTRDNSKEMLEQTLSLQKERITELQWDTEELRQKSLELELKLQSQVEGKLRTESMKSSSFPEEDELFEELEATKDQLNILLNQHEELEVKSRSDIKVLVKEVKSLRRTQNEIMQKLDESSQEKSELDKRLLKAMEVNQQALAARIELLIDTKSLHSRLEETNAMFLQSNIPTDSSSVYAVSELLAESDKQIGVLLTETQNWTPAISVNDDLNMDHELRLLLREIFVNNAKLRKQVNFFIQSALHMKSSTNGGKDAFSRATVVKQF